MLNLTVATVPFDIVDVFRAKTMQVTDPPLAAQVMLLPAAWATGPTFASTNVNTVGEKFMSHCTPAGLAPPPRLMFRVTVDPGMPEPLDKFSVA
jgi:hypothetical protein